jgi:hypothetical protein
MFVTEIILKKFFLLKNTNLKNFQLSDYQYNKNKSTVAVKI